MNSDTKTVYEVYDQWTFLVPVENLVLTKMVKQEFRVNRVTFISKSKLIRVRKRFGINQPIKKIGSSIITQDILNRYTVFAVLRITGEIENVKADAYNLVKEELLILSASQLGFGARVNNASPRISGFGNPGKRESIFIGKKNGLASSSSLKKATRNLTFTGFWLENSKRKFFRKALQIIRGEIPVEKAWAEEIRRALILIGESQTSDSKFKAFLWNMFVLEMLVSVQGDKFNETIPERLESILGWVGAWKDKNYSEKIGELYKKRCRFVHNGDYEGITARDLVFSEELLSNLFSNIVRYPKIFSSKSQLIQFSDKVKAEHLLGLKPRVRPMLRYFHTMQDEKHFKEIDEGV